MADYKMSPEWKQWAIDTVIPVIKAERDHKIGDAYDSLSKKIKKEAMDRGHFNSANAPFDRFCPRS